MKHNSKTTPQTPKDLLNDLHALVAEAEKMMSSSLSEQTADVISALRDRFENAQERFAEIYTGTQRKVVAGAKCTDEAIRANPYQSLAIAAGIGLLIGVLAGRSAR